MEDLLRDDLIVTVVVILGVLFLWKQATPLIKFIQDWRSLRENQQRFDARISALEGGKGKIYDSIADLEKRIVDRIEKVERQNHDDHSKVKDALSEISKSLTIVQTHMGHCKGIHDGMKDLMFKTDGDKQ